MSSVGSARAAVLAFALASGAMSPASAVEPSLDGAWAQDGSCEETFVRAGKGIAFKKPINVFAPALIITGNRLRTPTTSCTIKGMKPAGERRVLSLQCATAVAVEPVRALIGTSSDGSLVRYLNEQGLDREQLQALHPVGPLAAAGELICEFPLILAAAIVLQPTPGHSEILYARPDTEVAGAQYRWGNDVVPDAMPLKAALAFRLGQRHESPRDTPAPRVGCAETFLRRSRQPTNRSEVAGFREREAHHSRAAGGVGRARPSAHDSRQQQREDPKPAFPGFAAPPILSYNNAVSFIGCGRGRYAVPSAAHLDRPVGKDFWTADGSAVRRLLPATGCQRQCLAASDALQRL